MIPPIFTKFVELLDEFPEIGPRQAWRLFFWLLRQESGKRRQFFELFKTLSDQVSHCTICYFPAIGEMCHICADVKRDHSRLCIVARETDVLTIENSKKYKGRYFVLGGLMLPYEKRFDISKRLQDLPKKLKNIKTVLLALPFTREAEPTAQEVERVLKHIPHIKIIKPQKGIPQGGEIEFLDPETLGEALFKQE